MQDNSYFRKGNKSMAITEFTAMKEFKARIKHKRDTDVNWTQANPIILNGEIILVDTDDNQVRIKIGDGNSRYSQLSFADEVTINLVADKLLPDVSSEDNGKMLMVVNGAWATINPTVIYVGAAEPTNDIGDDGDLYLQEDSI